MTDTGASMWNDPATGRTGPMTAGAAVANDNDADDATGSVQTADPAGETSTPDHNHFKSTPPDPTGAN